MAKKKTSVAVTSKEKAHATFSASGAERWMNCPGSLALSEKAPPQPESPYATEGTKAHECLELILKGIEPGEGFTPEMIEHAQFAADYILNLAKVLPGSEVFSEQRIDSSPFTCSGQFGTLDAAIVQEFGELIIVDYKYGAGIAVEPEGLDGRGNSQLVYYALGLSHQYRHNFESVRLVVIQPRAYHEDGAIRHHTMTMEELLAWQPIFRNAVMETSDPKAPLNTGKWCRFCPAITICPEQKEQAYKRAQIVFSEENIVEVLPAPVDYKIPHLGNALIACDQLEEWIGKVRAHAIYVLERGHHIPGFKLVAKRGVRKWIDKENAIKDAKKLFGDKAFAEPELLSPAQMEKILGRAAVDFVNKRTISESSGTTLAPEADKRTAVKPLESVFGVLE